MDEASINQLLPTFGDLFEIFRLDFDLLEAECGRLVLKHMTHMVNLRALHLDGDGPCLKKMEGVPALFASLSELRLGSIERTIPIENCNELAILKLDHCSAKVSNQCLEATFPKLDEFIFWSYLKPFKFDDFIERHPQLTGVHIFGQFNTTVLKNLNNHSRPLPLSGVLGAQTQTPYLWRIAGLLVGNLPPLDDFCLVSVLQRLSPI